MKNLDMSAHLQSSLLKRCSHVPVGSNMIQGYERNFSYICKQVTTASEL